MELICVMTSGKFESGLPGRKTAMDVNRHGLPLISRLLDRVSSMPNLLYLILKENVAMPCALPFSI